MVSGIILTKFDKHIDLVNNILNNFLKQAKSIIQPNKDACKIKHIQNIRTPHSKWISSIVELKDKRLVSAGRDGLIVVYDHSHQPQIQIQNAHDKSIYSLCVLKNGDLASASKDTLIKIWRIGDNDYQLIRTLQGHTDWVMKVIELENGKLSSCSRDATIKIWNNYQCVKNLNGLNDGVQSIIEMNKYIISGSYDKTLGIWSQSTYQLIKTIKNVHCYSNNGLLKLNDNTLIVGGDGIIYVVDIKTSEVNKMKDESLENIYCLNVLKNGFILIGNSKGEMSSYDLSSNKIIFKQKFHIDAISCLIKTEDNHLISVSEDKTINVYKETYYFKLKKI